MMSLLIRTKPAHSGNGRNLGGQVVPPRGFAVFCRWSPLVTMFCPPASPTASEYDGFSKGSVGRIVDLTQSRLRMLDAVTLISMYNDSS